MKKLISAFFFIFALPIHQAMATESPHVVVSIKPIHSLTSAIMEGVGTPQLIVKKGSPHGYTLRPSEAKALANADLVVWVGHELEGFLAKPLTTLAQHSKKLELADQLASSLLTKRDGGEWEHHDHSKHEAHAAEDHHEHEEHAAADHHEHEEYAATDHDDHEAHAAEDHDEHEAHAAEDHHEHEEHAATDHDDHEAHAAEGHDEHEAYAVEEHHEHEVHDDHHGSFDLHIWLDPKVAQKIVASISQMLIEIDPEHAQQYQANTAQLNIKLIQLDQELKQKLAPVKDVPFLVFHSAYQYFETAYQLNSVGSVTIDPDRKPGAKGISDIRKKVQRLHAHCVFSEPQFESSLVATIIENSGAKTAVLDPLGSNIPAGSDAYFQLMEHLADNLIAGLL